VRKAIRDHARGVVAVILLVVVAAGVSGYILSNQRLRFPWESRPFELKAAFTTAQAVTPGQGQTVRVSGIRIGDISKVDLVDGRAVVTMQIEPRYKELVRRDAHALLRPKTGLKDMFIELDPGSPRAPVAEKGWTIPVANTLPDVNPDEIFDALDADTRDYLKLFVDGAGQGLAGRGDDLREVFRRFEPTHRDLARVSAKVAERRQSLKRLIHSLNLLNGELADRGDDLAQLVDSSGAVLRQFAQEQANVSTAVRRLPEALRQTTDALARVETFAEVLRPAATSLVPVARSLDAANQEVRPFAREAAPVIRDEIRKFVRDARPLVRDLAPAAGDLAGATPDLTRSFTVLNSLFNMIGFNPNGREDPSVGAKREEGYLFWIAWVNHNAAALFSSADANGPLRPLTEVATCSTLRATVEQEEPLEFLKGLTGVLTDPKVCG